MKNYWPLKSYFQFTSQQRTGIVGLFIIIIILEILYFAIDFNLTEKFFPEKEQWISLQSKVDSLKQIQKDKKPMQYSFNPNFISDYKGYKLGMSVAEIDRLLAFRKENKYVNSAEEFQEVTKVSDSLLEKISPLFKFPDWTHNKSNSNFKNEKKDYRKPDFKSGKIALLDINQASQEDLVKIYGIGDALSLRILKQKELLGAFVSMEQMNDIWGLSPEVVSQLNSHFKITIPRDLKKIPINDVSLKELSQFPYFKYALAKQIITYRSMNGKIDNIEDLIKIKDFPVEKAKIISLYLEF
ncbi:ComEA family DNA-binding protein [Flavobacterium daemonense]|uniref:ComEA family DNA-binding protein n=1 Tax=Flavobacterium daemonense TaxID=1393049 RepID=UPI00118501CD|nr:helix-hairpin-helix domain-containing protein [Flavobacterium daemonense]KAF2331929.1 helix-hairpin-helix domain-containing protein [Flavobacterium daemonense]